MVDYGIQYWANDDFFIEDGRVKVNYKNSPALIEIVKKAREDGYRGPLLIRFPHLIKKQIEKIFQSFEDSIKENHYKGEFKAVFPIKVNHYPNFI